MKHEITSYATKKMMADSLKKAMLEKPFSKITVSEIIKDCRINRKTFYYHFEDIYALLKWIFVEEAIETIKKFDLYTDYGQAIDYVAAYIDENRYIVNCAYDSVGRDVMKDFFYADFTGIVEKTMEQTFGIKEEMTDPKFRSFAVKFYTEAIAGITIEYAKERDEEKRKENLRFLKKMIEMQFKIAQ